MEPEFIDTVSALQAFLTQLGDSDGQPPRFYVDLEGNNLSRHGTLSLITLLLEPQRRLYLVDVTTLGHDAFTTAGSDGRTLQDILESKDIVKVFFDIRNDSDALFALYSVRAAGIEDLQLMELASRDFNKRNVNGLAKCIERDSTIAFDERQRWQALKDKGRDLFAPERGGSYAVFDRRPLSKEIQDYCIQDVLFMPHLRDVYRAKLCDAWWRKIETETVARIQLSQSPAFNGKGHQMARGPFAWVNWAPTLLERRSRVLFEAPPLRARSQVPSSSPIPSRGAPSGLGLRGERRGLLPERTEIGDDDSEVGGASRSLNTTPARLKEADELVELVRRVNLTGRIHNPSARLNEGSANAFDSNPGFGHDDSDGSKDLTACDKECGYCGRCLH